MKILLFGATGSAGGSVLRACLAAQAVEEVRAIVRRPLGLAHAKLRVLIHGNYFDFSPVSEAFVGVEACLYCLGISATQVSAEAEYRTITHDFALAAAQALQAHSPRAALHFISGQGTRLGSRMMWARIKAETERDLSEVVDTVCWRPAFIDGEASESAPWILQAARPLFRLLSPIRGLYVSGEDLGRAMLRTAEENVRGRTIENPEIRTLAEVRPPARQRGGTSGRNPRAG